MFSWLKSLVIIIIYIFLLQVSEAEVKSSHIVIPRCELRIRRDSVEQELLILKVLLKGATAPNNIIDFVLDFHAVHSK